MATTIEFATPVALRETAVTATLGHFATPRFGWSVTAGAIVGGSIEGRATRGGVTIAASASWLAVYERARRPFVAVSASLGTAAIGGNADDGSARTWSAWDIRGGAIAGKTFAQRVVPYVAARVFGGPVFWYRAGGGVVGSDRYHITAGLGLTVRLPGRVDVTLEGMPLGEQSATGAVTLHF
jgi:hypothetical protein